MQREFLRNLTDADYKSTAGVSLALFNTIYERFCRGTRAFQHKWQLYQLLYWFRNYPKNRHMKVLLGKRDLRNWMRSLNRRIDVLAAAMEEILTECWHQRAECFNPVRDFFGDNITAILDTFPVRCRRPRYGAWRAAMYQGKFKAYIVKFQLACRHDGVPVYLTGPHIGVRHDNKLWKRFKPALVPGEQWLADKAYTDDALVVPTKKPPGGSLTQDQLDMNIIHGFYRATIEHLNAQMKKFDIIGVKYRGQLRKDNGKLGKIVRIIAAIIALQVRASPLRRNEPVLSDEEKAAAEVAGREEAKAEADDLPPGIILGDPRRDLIVDDDGNYRSRWHDDDDLPNDHIDTGHSVEDFKQNEPVLIWWDELWWRAVVQSIQSRKKTLTVRWRWSGAVTSGYLPRLVRKMDDA